jgi:RHS repeat-associated protein
VQNTPAGKGCTTRAYAYNEDTDRTSLTTYQPNSKNECTTTEGTPETERHTYDTADRLTDTGVKYNEFGDITALPAIDAGGKEPSEELTSTYYTDNQLDTQTQNGETIGDNLDPAGRTLETVATGKKASDIIDHYAGPGSTPAWTSNSSGETTRNITGIGGQLAAIQNNAEAPELQLANLHGDIIAKAYLSETATALASTADTSEFGVPTTSLPSKYSWLGALELPTELPSGAIDMGARSYVPQLGRFLQPDPRPGGSANAYSYTFGDPVNTFDPSGELTYGVSAGVEAGSEAVGQEVMAREAAREAAARAAAEAAARAAAEAAGMAGPQYEEEEWWEEWEEEGGYEYASYQHGAKPESGEGHVEWATLVQSLGGEGGNGEGETTNGSPVPLCKPGSEGPCADDAYAGHDKPTGGVRRSTITIKHDCPVETRYYKSPEAHPLYRLNSVGQSAAELKHEYENEDGHDDAPAFQEAPGY